MEHKEHVDLLLDEIKTDGGTQTRQSVDELVVGDYAEAMLEGTEFPAIDVFYDGSTYWLADGFHRYRAYRFLRANGHRDREKIKALVHQGTRRDAVLYSVGANATHGLRRTNADKRRAVETLLNDVSWSRWSDREIARRCGVNNSMVSRMRQEIGRPGESKERQYVTKHGTVATMDTSNITGSSAPVVNAVTETTPSEEPKVEDRPFYEPEYDPEDEEVYEPEPDPIVDEEDEEVASVQPESTTKVPDKGLDPQQAVIEFKQFMWKLIDRVKSDSDKTYVLTVGAYWMDNEKSRIEGGTP